MKKKEREREREEEREERSLLFLGICWRFRLVAALAMRARERWCREEKEDKGLRASLVEAPLWRKKVS